MSSTSFQFKQFTVAQDRCAMKIGTDGVLLGAWTPISHKPDSILDVGAGTGVISLQLAQRSDASLIDAIEIDENAYEQCIENFEASPWNDRLFCYHASFQEFVLESEDTYDLIVSNPPFYSEDYQSNDKVRNTARFADALPPEHLLTGVTRLLSQNGVFTTILPANSKPSFIKIAEKAGLFLNKKYSIKGSPNANIKRFLLAFSFMETLLEEGTIVIETERHVYTEDYKKLVQDFYMKM